MRAKQARVWPFERGEREARQDLTQLLALGLRPRWLRMVVVRQHIWLLVIGTAVGLVIAAPAALLPGLLLPDFSLSVPWLQVGLLLFAISVAVLLSTTIAMRRLSPSRSTVRRTVR